MKHIYDNRIYKTFGGFGLPDIYIYLKAGFDMNNNMKKVNLHNKPGDWDGIRDRVSRLNKVASRRIARSLRSYAPFEDKFCIAAIGSDGRLEKGEVSSLEVVFYHRNITCSVGTELTNQTKGLWREVYCPLLGDSGYEAKAIESDTISVAFGNMHAVYPSRVFDSAVVHGDPQILDEAKRRAVAEWNGKFGQKVRKILKERKRQSKRVMETGTQEWKSTSIAHYNANCGKAFYNDLYSENELIQVRSVKPGPLRFVQGTIEFAVVAIARKLKIEDAEKLVIELPTPTIEKIAYLGNLGMLSLTNEQVERVVDCYLSFLRLYHASESGYVEAETVVKFDPKEARERIEALSKILEGNIVR